MTAYVDRNERVTTYAYDALGRRTEERWGEAPAESGSPAHSFAYRYDLAGRLTEVDDAHGPDFGYQYDALGRVGRTTITGLTSQTLVQTQAYDAAGRRTSSTVGHDGPTWQDVVDLATAYAYDAAGRLSEVEQTRSGEQAIRVGFQYDGASRLVQVHRAVQEANDGWTAPLASRYAYDAAGRLTLLEHEQSGQTIESYRQAYDARNRLTGQSSLFDGLTTYGYDDRNQLTSVDRDGTAHDETYTYDANGNRTSSTSAQTYLTGRNNRLQDDGTFTYEYVDEGNRTARTRKDTAPADDYRTEYVWDQRNRLTAVVEKNNAGNVTARVEYEYDYADKRIARRATTAGGPAQDERYLYDGATIVGVFTAAGTLTTSYLTVGFTTYAQQRSGHEAEWLLSDQLGSTRQVANSQGEVIAEYSYDAYGNLLAGSSDPRATTVVLYTGLRYDVETRTFRALLRDYEAFTGVWLSSDPIGFAGGTTNLTEYVGNNPVNFTDPTGLIEFSLFGRTYYGPFDSRASWSPGGTAAAWGTAAGDAWDRTSDFGRDTYEAGKAFSSKDLGRTVMDGSAADSMLGAAQEIANNGIGMAEGMLNLAGSLQNAVDPGSMQPVTLPRLNGRPLYGHEREFENGRTVGQVTATVQNVVCVARGVQNLKMSLQTGAGGACAAGGGALGLTGAPAVAAEGLLGATQAAGGTSGLVDQLDNKVYARSRTSGENKAAARGRQAHAEHDYGPGYDKTHTLPNGKRPDAVNVKEGIVIELKPNNPSAIRKGVNQVKEYAESLRQKFNKMFLYIVKTYDP